MMQDICNYNAATYTTGGLSNSSSSPSGGKLVSWVVETPGRGTLSLITTCLFTTFPCTWAVIHRRVTRDRRRRILHKLALFLKTIIALGIHRR